ncbi:YraN family protein [Paracoccus sp. Z330]|uniref:YraN family protein n=1 Tax=Paracoccus onchidii TaxID=3017813 RepID=A0ABT4ZDY8_9RHOB|nr:YraN family protein [Paracoccus onchidii]MDB6177499.1 YraN family protein [Paracoccus onchidii]
MSDQAGTAPVARRNRGALANLSGALAEDCVARHLDMSGAEILHRRWRGTCGEIDMIARIGACTVFIEVKQARTHQLAAQRLGQAQMRRICRAAAEFSSLCPDDVCAEMRFDAALVDAAGRVEIIENAFDTT